MHFDSSQQSAIQLATTKPFSMVTGGAGSGKTTIIKAITDTLESKGENVALCAFAGKAAARVREACQHPASTIHRLLMYDGSRFACTSLSSYSVIIDESSMIDTQLLSEVIKRKPNRLCLIGDPAQLPPVGRGQPFHDILKIKPNLVASLTTCYRATEAVFKSATAIRNGVKPPMQATSEGEKWSMVNTGDAKRTQVQILDWVKSGLFDFEQDVILVIRNGESDDDACTVRGLNKVITDMISPRENNRKFNVGDRIINTKNLPYLDCWNGTTGTVHAIDQDNGIWVRTDIPVIDYSKTSDVNNPAYTSHVLFSREKRKHLELAYALTTHKSQGSQYRRVLFAGFNRDLHSLLDRSLLYTAVTRTKQACCVVGELSAAFAAIDRVCSKRTIMQMIAEG
jgi:exodeoxyribonuclease V alpha subunit